jgi:ATP-dependent helicase/nuclease subunit A
MERRLLLSLDLPYRGVVVAREFTEEQLKAIGRRDGALLVRAGAGTGKTSVLVERFVGAVLEDGEAVESILAITFTEKAAAELKSGVRKRFLELGERERARESEGAWISTIHGFCSRVLRSHALSAGIDPDYRVLDGVEAERLALLAFDRALEEFLGEGADPQRLEMVAAYTPDRLRDMVRTAYSKLRSAGQRRPALEEAQPRRDGGERERLDRAVRAALADLGAGPGGVQVDKEMKRLERCVEAIERAVGEELPGPGQFQELELKGTAKALSSTACEEYREALAAWLGLIVEHEGYRTHTLLRVLLDLHGRRYEELKRERSGLDFEDLELIARDLLRDHAGLREQYAERFSHVMIDEFQDTNRLQNELLDLLSRDNLFRVGDENQSIYGFRHADVALFREHHRVAADADRAEPLTVNFRSRGEVLDAIDMAFSELWGEAFEPLRPGPGARSEPARVSPSVELLVVDKRKERWDEHFGDDPEPFGRSMRGSTAWRACEARLLAKRVDELIGAGRFRPGEVVLLLRATTHMSFYERALEERGVPTHVVGGRGYWAQQQVADLRHWLAALANPLDGLAVYSVLASPLVGASLDAVALVGLAARRDHGGDPWWALEEAFGGGDGPLAGQLPDGDRERIGRFVELFRAERVAAPGFSLETLIDRAVTVTGYDRRVLALPAGDRRLANVRKLMRMAREFEAGEGRDLRAFIDFVGERDLIQERQGEAPLESEALDAVRIMTIHRSKGLEFPAVVVADLGKDGREDYGALRISEDGRLGLRLSRLGGGPIDTAELERLKKEERIASEEEERRIFYVAATRAQEHLVLSGATDLEKLDEPRPLDEPMRWVWRCFCPALPSEGAAGGANGSWDGREVPVRWTRCTPATIGELLSERDRTPARPAPAEETAPALAPLELATVPAPRALAVSRLSYSALASYDRCAYRFYLERALRLRGGEALQLARGGGLDVHVEPDDIAADELPALLRGTVVHELLEGVDFARPSPPSEAEVEAAIERHGEPVRPDDVADVRSLAAAFVSSPLCERIGRARRARTELPFAFTLAPDGTGGRSLLLNGVVDVHADQGEGTLILDYKSDRLEGETPARVCEEKYATQRVVYALAALRAGAGRVEVVYLFLERPEEPVVSSFEAADAGRLEAELLELAGGVVEARFPVTDEPHRELCADCPGQPALCSWEPEQTLAKRAEPVR